jgi:hypothetical protein
METVEMLRMAYGAECLSMASASEWQKMFREAQKVRMQKSLLKTMLIAFFGSKSIIHQELLPEKQTGNGKFHKEAIKRLAARAHCVSLSFRKVPHDNAPAHSSGAVSEFLAN